MKIALFGLPASGKGTQSEFITQNYGLPSLSTGDLLRRLAKEDQTELGEKVRAVPVGHFASDELIVEAVKVELKKEKYQNGVVFDGFPRTESQSKTMIEMGLIPDAVVFIKADEGKLKERITNRRVHAPSGRTYNLLTNPPAKDGIDDLTQEPLTHREDDKEEFINQRFSDFNEKTMPAYTVLKSLCKYGSGPVLVEINGMQELSKVSHDLNVGINSTIAIHKLRKEHTFALIQANVDVNSPDILNKETAIRSAMHQSLMLGEIPFSPYLLYSQPNILNLADPEQKKLLIEISKQFIDKFDKLVIYIDDAEKLSSPIIRKVNGGKELTLDEGTNELLEYAFNKKKTIELRDLNGLPVYKVAKAQTPVLLDLPKENIDNGKTLKEVKNSPNFVIIESPYAGDADDIKRNEYYARSAIVDCLNKGEIPIASHLLYTQAGILEDGQSAQRRLGIEAGLITGLICSKSVMYANYGMSVGMEEGVERAKREGRDVEIRTIEDFEKKYETENNKVNKKDKLKIKNPNYK